MKLASKTLTQLAEMILGSAEPYGRGDFCWEGFRYRSHSQLTEFFDNCEVDTATAATSRKPRAVEILKRLNEDPADDPALPSASIVRVIKELMDERGFGRMGGNRDRAVEALNEVLERDSLQVRMDEAGRPEVWTTQGGFAANQQPRLAWTQAEARRRDRLSRYLDCATEDDLTANVLLPMFAQLGFSRPAITGHRDRQLEFGRDLWMKYRLPTGHVLYFGAQVKRGTIDARGRTGGENISTVLTQARMMFGRQVLDPETNKRTSLDHVFVICSGEITNQAKEWLEQALDDEGRRRILFIDRDAILDKIVGAAFHLPLEP